MGLQICACIWCKKHLGHLISPLRVNGSAIESVFSSLKYIAGSHLSSTNYSTTLGAFVTQKETTINPIQKKDIEQVHYVYEWITLKL